MLLEDDALSLPLHNSVKLKPDLARSRRVLFPKRELDPPRSLENDADDRLAGDRVDMTALEEVLPPKERLVGEDHTVLAMQSDVKDVEDLDWKAQVGQLYKTVPIVMRKQDQRGKMVSRKAERTARTRIIGTGALIESCRLETAERDWDEQELRQNWSLKNNGGSREDVRHRPSDGSKASISPLQRSRTGLQIVPTWKRKQTSVL
jgi:hypothetical protein